MTKTTLHTDGITDPALAGIINLDNFTPQEIAILRAIHRRVVRDKARTEHERIERIVQDNLVLKRLLASLRNITKPTKENTDLLKQIDHHLRQR